ncbi:MAG: hypothetical protein ACRDI3_06435 [Actinomycetota bacterium]
MIKRLAVFVMILSLVVGTVAVAEAGKKKKKAKKPVKTEREAQGTYSAPATLVGNCTQTDGIGCMTIASGPEEAFLTAKVTDAHGQPVSISVEADLDGDAMTETDYGTFCGETEEPIQIDPGAEIIFWVGRADIAVADACAPGVATQGTLDVVFSNLP